MIRNRGRKPHLGELLGEPVDASDDRFNEISHKITKNTRKSKKTQQNSTKTSANNRTSITSSTSLTLLADGNVAFQFTLHRRPSDLLPLPATSGESFQLIHFRWLTSANLSESLALCSTHRQTGGARMLNTQTGFRLSNGKQKHRARKPAYCN